MRAADNGHRPDAEVDVLRQRIAELERDLDAADRDRDEAELERDLAQRQVRELRRRTPSGDDEPSALGEVPEYPADALPSAAVALVHDAAQTGLPEALVAGAALAAMAAAIGPKATLKVQGGWIERPILWVPLLAPAGAGKSPAQDLAFRPLREHDARLVEDDDRVLLDDMTLEALARELHGREGAGALDLDELAVLLRGLGEYKRAGGGDRGRFLKLWTGAPWLYQRVGTGKQTNAVRLRVEQPTVVICGGLQPRLHELLGGEDDGMRPRWLPHLAPMPEREGLVPVASATWDILLDRLVRVRGTNREWRLDQAGQRAFKRYRAAWKQQARGVETAGVSAALVKADVHLARVLLVLAEADGPGGVKIGAELVDRAAKIVDFTLACWRALPAYGSLGLSRRDQALDRAGLALLDWLERRPERKATQREVQRARVGGARTPNEIAALLARYQETFPGCVTEESGSHGGKRTTVVKAPDRVVYPNVTTGDTGMHAPSDPRSRAIFDAEVLSLSGDSGDSGDSGEG